MKNVHILPTDKPSRLYLEFGDGDLCLVNNALPQTKRSNNQHIYITSDEEIKAGDYFWKPDCNMIFKAEYTPHKGCQKIILTTDFTLAPNVHKISDEFLEWFVKNPSCEGVEVEDTCLEVRVCDCAMNENCLKPGYTIIIPQEEPKKLVGERIMPLDNDNIEEEEETLEEIAENELRKQDWDTTITLPFNGGYIEGFQQGAKWQQEQERMYSEEEVLSIIDKAFHMYASSHRHDAKEWFEQFKNK